MRALVLAIVVAIAACSAPTETTVQIFSRMGYLVPGTGTSVVVDGDVGIQVDNKIVARIPREVGATTPLPIEGRACSIRVTKLDVEIESRLDPKKEPRTYNGATFDLACTDGPAPRSQATYVGARSLASLPWLLPGIVLAIGAGLLGRRFDATKTTAAALAAVGAGALALAIAIALPVWRFESWYAAAYASLGTGLALATYAHARVLNTPGATISPYPLIAPVVIVGIVAVVRQTWSMGSPVAALVLAAIGWIVTIALHPSKRP